MGLMRKGQGFLEDAGKASQLAEDNVTGSGSREGVLPGFSLSTSVPSWPAVLFSTVDQVQAHGGLSMR